MVAFMSNGPKGRPSPEGAGTDLADLASRISRAGSGAREFDAALTVIEKMLQESGSVQSDPSQVDKLRLHVDALKTMLGTHPLRAQFLPRVQAIAQNLGGRS